MSTGLSLRSIFVLFPLLLGSVVGAQTAGNNPDKGAPQPEGWEGAGYIIHQSLEIGYRASDVTGSQQMYNSLVNLRGGPRFLDQSLSMQSQNHEGVLFENPAGPDRL